MQSAKPPISITGFIFFFAKSYKTKQKEETPTGLPEWSLLADTYPMSFGDSIMHSVMHCMYCQSISAIKHTSHINLGFQMIMSNTHLKTGS